MPIPLALGVVACGRAPADPPQSNADRPRGIAALVAGPVRAVSRPGARWAARRQDLRPLTDDAPPVLVASVRGRLLYRLADGGGQRFACRLESATTTQSLTADGDADAPVVSGDRWAALSQRRVPGGLRGYRMALIVGNVSSGRIVRRLHVATRDSLERGDVAISPRGDVAVTWYRGSPDGVTFDAMVSVLDAGATTLGPPKVLARDVSIGGFTSYYQSELAFGPRGDLLVVEEDDEIRARRRPPDGRIGRAERVGPRTGTLLVPAVTADRRAIIAWSGGDHAGFAISGSAAGPFGAPQTLSVRGGTPQHLEVAAGPRGPAVLGWSTRSRTWTIDLRPDGGAAPPQAMAGDMQALSVSPDGRLLLVTDEGHGRALRARLRSAGAATFGPPEPLAGTATASDVLAEFAPRTGRPVVSVVASGPSETREGDLSQALVIAARR